MTKLSDAARFVKSNNAGAAYLTFDIGFRNSADFERVAESGALNEAVIAKLYPYAAGQVRIYHFRPALVIKITIPRPVPSGGVNERDFDGVQQYAPLLDVDVPG